MSDNISPANDFTIGSFSSTPTAQRLAIEAHETGKQSCLQRGIDQLTSLVVPDQEFRTEVNNYTAAALKTGSLMFKGHAALVTTMVLHGADQAGYGDSAGNQIIDGALGAAKGGLMKGLFGVVGNSQMSIGTRAFTLGFGSRAVDTLGTRQTYLDSSGNLSGDAAYSHLKNGVFSGDAVFMDLALAGAAHGLFKGANSLTGKALERSKFLSTIGMGSSFGFVTGGTEEFMRQKAAGVDSYDFGKVVMRAGIRAAVDGVASIPAGVQADPILRGRIVEKARDAKAALSERLDAARQGADNLTRILQGRMDGPQLAFAGIGGLGRTPGFESSYPSSFKIAPTQLNATIVSPEVLAPKSGQAAVPSDSLRGTVRGGAVVNGAAGDNPGDGGPARGDASVKTAVPKVVDPNNRDLINPNIDKGVLLGGRGVPRFEAAPVAGDQLVFGSHYTDIHIGNGEWVRMHNPIPKTPFEVVRQAERYRASQDGLLRPREAGIAGGSGGAKGGAPVEPEYLVGFTSAEAHGTLPIRVLRATTIGSIATDSPMGNVGEFGKGLYREAWNSVPPEKLMHALSRGEAAVEQLFAEHVAKILPEYRKNYTRALSSQDTQFIDTTTRGQGIPVPAEAPSVVPVVQPSAPVTFQPNLQTRIDLDSPTIRANIATRPGGQTSRVLGGSGEDGLGTYIGIDGIRHSIHSQPHSPWTIKGMLESGILDTPSAQLTGRDYTQAARAGDATRRAIAAQSPGMGEDRRASIPAAHTAELYYRVFKGLGYTTDTVRATNPYELRNVFETVIRNSRR